MIHNGIKSFSIYFEFVDLIDILSDEEQAYLYLDAIRYIFYDIEPKNLTDKQRKIWTNLIRPLNKSKSQALNTLKRHKDTTNQHTNEDTNLYTNEDTNSHTKCDTKDDTQSKMFNVNVNDLEDKGGMGEKETFIKIIDYLNNKAGTNFRYSSKVTQTKIKARLNEGYKLDDFIVVIDKKYDEWKKTDFEQFLRPETLFGTKFESYLNQKSKNKSPEWLDKNVSNEKLTAEEEQEMKEMLKEFSEDKKNG